MIGLANALYLSLATSGDGIVQRIEALSWPKYDWTRSKETNYLDVYSREVSRYKNNLNALTLLLIDVNPSHRRLPELLIRRWEQCDEAFMTQSTVQPTDVLFDAQRIRRMVTSKEAKATCDFFIALKRAEVVDSKLGASVRITKEYIAQKPPSKYLSGYLVKLGERANFHEDGIWHIREYLRRFPRKGNLATGESDTQDQLESRLHRLLMIGKPLEISFKDGFSGEEISTNSHKRKVILIDFTSMSCGPCVANKPELKRMVDKFSKSDLFVVSISGDATDEEKEALKKLKEANEIRWPVAIEGSHWDGPLFRRFRIRRLPSMMLIDRKGVLREIDTWNPENQIRRLIGERS